MTETMDCKPDSSGANWFRCSRGTVGCPRTHDGKTPTDLRPKTAWIPAAEIQIPVIRQILVERQRQEKLKNEGRFLFTAADLGLQHSEKLPMLTEELGEIAKRIQQLPHEGLMPVTHAGNFDGHRAGDLDPEAGTEKAVEKELVQLAAIAFAWLEAIHSTNGAAPPAPWQPQTAETEAQPPPV